MPTMKGNVSIPANSTVNTILSGQDYEFLPSRSFVSLWASESATGLTVSLKAQSEDLISDGVPNIASAAGRVQTDTDVLVQGEACSAGTRLRLSATNSTAGALTLNYLIDISPF